MASRYEVEVAVAGADALKNVNWRHGKLRPYAVVWVDPAGGGKFSTRVDDDGDTSPRWTDKLLIPYDSPAADAILYVDIVHANADANTKPLVGSARLPLNDVLDASGGRLERKVELRRPSGRPQGTVELHVAVREPPRYAARESPYVVPPYGVPPRYAAPPPAQGYVVPESPGYGGVPPGPPPVGYGPAPGNAQPGFGGAPPAGYGPAPGNAQPGLGGAPPAWYGPAPGNAQAGGPPADKKKSKFGGIGTGLAVGAVAGALGGLVLKEGYDRLEDKIADDAAERVKEDMYDDDDY